MHNIIEKFRGKKGYIGWTTWLFRIRTQGSNNVFNRGIYVL